jgi:hypothetical protein
MGKLPRKYQNFICIRTRGGEYSRIGGMEPVIQLIHWIPQSNKSATASPSSANRVIERKKSTKRIPSMESKTPYAANESPWVRMQTFIASGGARGYSYRVFMRRIKNVASTIKPAKKNHRD